jgi:hypothetical protein
MRPTKEGWRAASKNAGEIIKMSTNDPSNPTQKIIDSVDFSVNEQCAIPDNDECDTFHAFIDAGKPVFHIEYPDSAPNISNPSPANIVNEFCKANGEDGMSTVKTLPCFLSL